MTHELTIILHWCQSARTERELAAVGGLAIELHLKSFGKDAVYNFDLALQIFKDAISANKPSLSALATEQMTDLFEYLSGIEANKVG